ncbi:MAG: hypothetical protein U1A77_16605 [Pirellulales bacterium]
MLAAVRDIEHSTNCGKSPHSDRTRPGGILSPARQTNSAVSASALLKKGYAAVAAISDVRGEGETVGVARRGLGLGLRRVNFEAGGGRL